MPRPPSRPSRSRRQQPAAVAPKRLPRAIATRWLAVAAGLAVVLAASVSAWTWTRDRPERFLAEARAATDARDWPRAYAAWHSWNATSAGTAATWLLEAQLAADLGQSRAAAALATRINRADPARLGAWTIELNRLRVLDQPAEALRVGLSALERVRDPDDRRQILRLTTLATLAEVPDAEARAQLDRWIAADPDDLDARAARLSRIAANPLPGDPDRATRIDRLQAILDGHPDQTATRAALIAALADSGAVDRGRALLTTWPQADRDDRFDRLQARWDLEYDHEPARAADGFRRALLATPHDWRPHYGLARALRTLGQTDEAEAEALAVTRLRERLDPVPLGARLTTDFARSDAGATPDVTTAWADLAALCRSVGLSDLAQACDRANRPDPRDSPQAF